MPLKQHTFGFDNGPNEEDHDKNTLKEEQTNIPQKENSDESTPVVGVSTPAAANLFLKKSTRGRMKLSDMNIAADLIEVPEDEILFQKSYYSIGNVAEMFRVNISLIRFWENEFDILKPKKNAKGDRYFRPEDVKNLKLIYHLLREKKYTIEGAKDFLKKNKAGAETLEVIESLKKIKSFLIEIKTSL